MTENPEKRGKEYIKMEALEQAAYEVEDGAFPRALGGRSNEEMTRLRQSQLLEPVRNGLSNARVPQCGRSELGCRQVNAKFNPMLFLVLHADG